MSAVLSINQLSKRYGSTIALNGVSLSVEKGSVVGILGPNGSGKTTLLSVVLGLRSQNSGSFSWFDHPNGIIPRQQIGALVEVPNYYPYLNLEDNLRLSTLAKGIDQSAIYPVVERVGLTANLKTKVSAFSLGMKQRLALAQAILGNPEVIILDEPTNGLDPVGIVEVRNLIHELRLAGKTIILASHNLDEVQRTCTHVAVLKAGQLIAAGSVPELLTAEKVAILEVENPEVLSSFISINASFELLNQQNHQFTLLLFENLQSSEFMNLLVNAGIRVNGLEIRNLTLEELFVRLVRAKGI